MEESERQPTPAEAALSAREQGADAPAQETAAGDFSAENVAMDVARRVRVEAARVLEGMDDVLDLCMIALFAAEHVLLEGPPGVAKTMLVRTLATCLGSSFSRLSFTPDLMPSDVTGTSVFHPGEGLFRFREGPIFAQFVLCDEINRAPAKTQSALLEAMQEGVVTIDGSAHVLPRPFNVFATKNPIEHEGTYPLPEAQLDRFGFQIQVGYPEPRVEARLLQNSHTRDPMAAPADLGVRAVADPAELMRARAEVDGVIVREDLPDYLVRLLGRTRNSPSLALGASPRAGVLILRASKAHAALSGRNFVTPDDIKAVFVPALRHRVMLEPAEEIEGVQSDDVLRAMLDEVEVPR